MKKKTSFYLTIALAVVVICVLGGIVCFKNKNSLKTIDIKEVKVVTLYPSHGRKVQPPYTYNIANTEDMKVISEIINYLQTGKSIGTEKITSALNGTGPEHLDISLTNGKCIVISTEGASEDQLFVSQSSTNVIYIFYSPQLRKLFTDEFKRMFNS